MVGLKLFFKFAFVPSTILASIISSFPNLTSKKLPSRTPTRNTTSPVRMLIASVFLATKCIIALLGTKMMPPTSGKLSIRQSNRFTTGVTWHYRENGIIDGHYLFVIVDFQIHSIASKRTPPSNFGLITISNKFLPADFAYQLSHNYIIPQLLSWNEGKDYRMRKGG